MQKKLLSLVLMLIAAINIFAYDFESNGIYYNILSKENRTCTVTSQPNTTGKKYTGSIVIPSIVQDNNGEDYTVTEIGNYAFMDCVKLQNIVLPNTIQKVGYCAFQGCILLKNITLPQSVVTVSSNVFKGCISLEKIELGQIKEITSGCFNGCVSLEYIQIPNSVREISGIFDGCSSLKTISFESGIAKLRFPRYDVFKNCPLDSIFIGRNFDIYEDTPPLAKSETLKSVFVSDSVTYLSASLLRDCKNLENIYGMNHVDSIGAYCFAGTKIKKFCAPSLRTFGGYGYAFDKCQNLEELVLGKIVNVSGYWWIGDCPNLRNIYIGTELKTIGGESFFPQIRNL